MDTIFALSTAQGKAGLAVVRVSGPAAFDAAEKLAGPLPSFHRAGLRTIYGDAGEVLDEGLVIAFPEKHSFTGENVVEFQLHGSVAIVSAVLDRLAGLQGLRLAEPGEFTRRAMENGQLDLTRVEGLADLIEAETDSQRRQAALIFSGALGRQTEEWRKALVHAMALLDATIDFADEDVPGDVGSEVYSLLAGVRDDLRREVAGGQAAERIRSGFEVAIVGPPNVGKSTLLNRLAGREAAITSEYAGTTRDVIEVRMDLDGLSVTFLDTAGLQDTEDKVEKIGINRARDRAAAADLRVYLFGEDDVIDLASKPGDIIKRPKVDLKRTCGHGVSGKTGEGLPELISEITEELKCRTANAGLATRSRHRQAMVRGAEALDVALKLVTAGESETDLAAEETRRAVQALDSLVGKVDVESVLGDIFASFCLGK